MAGGGSNGEYPRPDVDLFNSEGTYKALSGVYALMGGVGLSVLTNDSISKGAEEAGRSPAFLIATTVMAGIGSAITYAKSQRVRSEVEQYEQHLSVTSRTSDFARSDS